MPAQIEQRMHSVNGRKVPHEMLIPSRAMVEAKIAAIAPGAVGSLAEIRKALAADTGADACCPVTTQRHLRAIAADVAARRSATPYWRVVDPETPTARHLAGGADFVRDQLRAERSSAKKSPERARPSARRSS